MKTTINVLTIVAVIVGVCAWPANASQKRDQALQKCSDANFKCESNCLDKGGSPGNQDSPYSKCIKACSNTFRVCNDKAGAIARSSVPKADLKDLQTLTPSNTVPGQGSNKVKAKAK